MENETLDVIELWKRYYFGLFGVPAKMVASQDIQELNECLGELSANFKLIYKSLRNLKNEQVKETFLKRCEKYMKNGNSRFERMKSAYNAMSTRINEACDDYVNEVKRIEEEDRKDTDELSSDIKEMDEEVQKRNTELKAVSLQREPSFVYCDSKKSVITVDLVKKYPGSYLYREYASEKRTRRGNVFIDCYSRNDELIVKYMKNDDKSLIEDVKKMNNEARNKLIDDLDFMQLPVKKDMILECAKDEDNEIMEAWKHKKVLVNGMNDIEFFTLLQSNDLLDSLIKNKYSNDIQYDRESKKLTLDIKLKYYDVIVDYLKNKKINRELLRNHIYDGSDNELIREMMMVGIDLNEDEKKEIRGYFDPRFLRGSKILLDTQYDSYLRDWVGDKNLELIFRASEYEHVDSSFHKYCDDKGPTLVIIKSSEGWIFGGYTTQSWSRKCIFYD